MAVDLFKIFKRVVGRLVERGGMIRDKVADVPSSFLVAVARLKQQDKDRFNSYLKSSVDESDEGDAAASVSQLQEYVGELQHKGRNRSKIKRKGARARKGKRRKAVR